MVTKDLRQRFGVSTAQRSISGFKEASLLRRRFHAAVCEVKKPQGGSEFAAGTHAQAALKAKQKYLAEKDSRVLPLAPKSQSKTKDDR